LPLSPTARLPGLVEKALQLLEPPHKLLLLPGGQAVPHARPGAVKKLSGHGADAALDLAGEDLICELLEAGPEPRKL
jgi:hypothetical protein